MPLPPKALKARGRKLWTYLHEDYEYDLHDTALVLEICRTLDTIDALSEAIEADGVMVTGSQGQAVLNGAVAELRQQQSNYARLLPMLNLDANTEMAPILTLSASRAAKAAKGRWTPAKDARKNA